MPNDPAVQAALAARDARKAPERFEADPPEPSAFGALNEAKPASLASVFAYDPATGSIVRIAPTGRGLGAVLNSAVGYIDADGYRAVRLNGKLYRAHRVAWALHYGQWPDGILDHINGDRSDNRIANLRMASYALNAQNRLGVAGFYKVEPPRRPAGKYVARIGHEGKLRNLGHFDTETEARDAYLAAKRELHSGAVLDEGNATPQFDAPGHPGARYTWGAR